MIRLQSCLWAITMAVVSLATPASTQDLNVYRVPLDGSVSNRTFTLIEHAIAESEVSGAIAILLELDLEGDDLELALEIARMISESPVSVYAYVKKRAWNAAALVALASDSIYMKTGATLGGHGVLSMPHMVEQNTLQTPVSELFAQYAAAHGADPSIGRAIVDSTVVLRDVSDAGIRLELKAHQAVELGVAVAEVRSVEELLDEVNLAGSRWMTINEAWFATTVRIENRNWQDINIFVRLTGGMRIRLGTVTSMSSGRYTVPGHVLLSSNYIQVVAEIIGSDDGIETEIVQVEPGTVIEWNIENVLRNSTYFIWVRS